MKKFIFFYKSQFLYSDEVKMSIDDTPCVQLLVLTSGWSVLAPGHKQDGSLIIINLYSQNTTFREDKGISIKKLVISWENFSTAQPLVSTKIPKKSACSNEKIYFIRYNFLISKRTFGKIHGQIESTLRTEYWPVTGQDPV